MARSTARQVPGPPSAVRRVRAPLRPTSPRSRQALDDEGTSLGQQPMGLDCEGGKECGSAGRLAFCHWMSGPDSQTRNTSYCPCGAYRTYVPRMGGGKDRYPDYR